ncbi:hypothetical protein [Thiocapsa bogorovii]|uniref:hypothetical protein n=1 Tax=Thiocapsa bogorovii TaxID=521689 RepID=UPI001E5FD9B8|nr:hypothetical protein [Thiocapsa bogorovii]UHD15717.1 hypothetical protein LT988_21050 [Thiocapsa bogorovii]
MKPQQIEMKSFRVTASYPGYGGVDPWDDYVDPHTETAELESADAHQAAVDAVLRRLIPVMFIGAEPIYFDPDTFGSDGLRWPSVPESSSNEVVLGFGDDNNPRTLVISVESLN